MTKRIIHEFGRLLRLLLPGALSMLAVLVVWLFLSRFVSDLVLPSPTSVLHAARNAGLGDLTNNAWQTLRRVVLGWIIGGLLGIPAALIMTRSRIIHQTIRPLIELVRPLPTVALVPFFIFWFGIGPFGQVFLIAIGSFMTLTIHTYTAVNTVPLALIRAAASLGATMGRIYVSVILPFLLPSLRSAFQIAAGLSFAVGIAAEWMGAQSGLGFMVMVARRTLNTNTILLCTLLIGVESYLLDVLIRFVFDYLCRWAEPPIDSLRKFNVNAQKDSLCETLPH